MAYIKINSITFSPPAIGSQVVTVQHKLASDPDVPGSYTIDDASLDVNADGTFVGGPFYINGLTDGIVYTIKITNNCSGEGTQENEFAGTTTSTTLPVVDVNSQYLSAVSGSMSLTISGIGPGVLAPTPLVSDEVTSSSNGTISAAGTYNFDVVVDVDVATTYTLELLVNGVPQYSDSLTGDQTVNINSISVVIGDLVIIRLTD
jgi:hypothetical protein